MYPIFTKAEANKILYSGNDKVNISLDLGITTSEVEVKDGIAYIGENKVALSELESVKENFFYIADENTLKRVAMFSEETNFYYKLLPTTDWPTITFSSTPMHRHTRLSPKEDTQLKIKEISPITGIVLDTCCGLGYTAIMAAKTAQKVFVFERDSNVLHVASFNPYSRELFESKNIELRKKDVYEGVTEFSNNFFDRIIHDPPTVKYSPLLYSGNFYRELYRTLKKRGILYHYAPSPKKTHGEVFYRNIIRNLKHAGFKDVTYSEKSSGVRAVK